MKRINFVAGVVFLLGCMNVYAGQQFKDIVVFGDSLSDPGNVFVVTGEQSIRPFNEGNIPSAPYARGGHHFSNGPTWIEQLSKALKLKGGTGPALRTTAFTNYAFGAARARAGYGDPFDLTTQVGLYLLNHGDTLNSDTLFSVYVGGNDVRDALVEYQTVYFITGSEVQAFLAAQQILNEAVESIANNITALAQAGASQFLVPNAPNVGVAPAVKALGSDAAFLATVLSAGFNEGLSNTVDLLEGGLGINIVEVDVFKLLTEATMSPELYGFTNASDACITPLVKKKAFCNKPDDYLFWDGIHPTRAGHSRLSDLAAEALMQ